jgi:transaldolase
MTVSLESLVASGTRLWLDSIDPEFVERNRRLGATGATSNPIIVADIVKSGHCDARIGELAREGLDDEAIAWSLTDELVRAAQAVFLPVWEETRGNDGYVSFELDPLLEDPELGPPHAERVARYVELGRRWSAGQRNRMIKVPATPAGLAAIEELVAAGVTVNVTLIFTPRQYRIARDAAWRGARRRESLAAFKSVYSIFVSRVDVYTEKHVPELFPPAQGLVGIVNAKRIWRENRAFWADKALPLQQEMIFASTGTKKPEDPPDKYVEAFAGSDIETNPPATNDWVARSGKRYRRRIDELPPPPVLAEIARTVDLERLERVLMAEGVAKFADPLKALLALIGEKRSELAEG